MPYTRSQRGNTICAPDSCTANQIVSWTGVCVDCLAGTTPDATGRNCVTGAVTCGDREIYDSETEACIQCKPYTRAKDNNTRCGSDVCSLSNEVVNE